MIFPANVTGMINEVKIAWQMRERVQQIVLGNEGVIGGAEINEPIPVITLRQSNSGGVESVGDHGGATVGDEVGLGDDPDVAELLEGEVAVHVACEEAAVFRGGVAVEVEDVAVAGVVEGGERAEDGGGVGGGAGDEVGEARRERGGGWGRERKKLGLDEGGGGRRSGGGDREWEDACGGERG